MSDILSTEARKPFCDENGKLQEEKFPSKNPITIFKDWFQIASIGNDEANTMSISTVDGSGMPNTRVVLHKSVDDRGFIFYTHYESSKARDLAQNPKTCLLFHWPKLFWCVKIQGIAEKLTSEENEQYFKTRPRHHQISTVSTEHQGPVESRQIIDDRAEKIEKLYAGKEIPWPNFWGGYIVKPIQIEFYQGQESRLSDRILFRKADLVGEDDKSWKRGDNGWVYQRLEP